VEALLGLSAGHCAPLRFRPEFLGAPLALILYTRLVARLADLLQEHPEGRVSLQLAYGASPLASTRTLRVLRAAFW